MKNLLAAFLKAQQEFPSLPKDGSNPAFRSRYATLGSVQETAFPVLAKHGLVVLQSVRSEMLEDGRVLVYVGAALCHVESGEQTSHELGMIPAKQDPQGVGSAVTYGRRYVLMTMLGLVPDDEDGNAASGQAARPPAAKFTPPAPGKPAAKPQAPPPPDDRLPDADAVDRPRWQNTDEAKSWARQFNVFEAPQHLNNAYNQACERGGLVKGQPATPEIRERTFDAWFTDVMRRAAEAPSAIANGHN